MINRNNYEEYFLLLADNELSPAEAAAVKQFAAQHPDLAEELELLLACRLETGPLPVFPKQKLLRPVMWNAEDIEPVQTQMLLLLDGELNPAEQAQLQQQIAASTTLQSEWDILQQAKLPTEAIPHPNKETLRHNTVKVRPLLWMRWVAAAAVVAGLGWLFWLQQAPQTALPAHNTLAGNIEQEQRIVAPAGTEPQPSAIENTATPEPAPTVAATAAAVKPGATKQSGAQVQEATPHSTGKKEDPAPANTFAVNTSAGTEPVEARPVREADIHLSIDASEPVPVMQVAHLEPSTSKLSILTNSRKAEPYAGNRPALLAEEEEDYVMIGAAHVNKQKMRGLLRNVTRTVARGFSKSKMEPDVYATR